MKFVNMETKKKNDKFMWLDYNNTNIYFNVFYKLLFVGFLYQKQKRKMNEWLRVLFWVGLAILSFFVWIALNWTNPSIEKDDK